MRKTKSKQIRKLIGYDPKNHDPILKKLYKRAKKTYNKLSSVDKPNFFKEYE